MAVTFFTDFLASPLSNFAGGVILPFQSGISKVGSWMNVRSQELKTIRDIMQENEALQAQVDALTIENNSLQQDKYELTLELSSMIAMTFAQLSPTSVICPTRPLPAMTFISGSSPSRLPLLITKE